MFKRLDMRFRKWLCAKFGHKFYCDNSGHYPGLPQSHCWRCGKTQPGNPMPDKDEPLGRWFT